MRGVVRTVAVALVLFPWVWCRRSVRLDRGRWRVGRARLDPDRATLSRRAALCISIARSSRGTTSIRPALVTLTAPT